MQMIKPYQIVLYDGNFYRFIDERGSPHTLAGERHFNEINRGAKIDLIIPLQNKYGFTMTYNGEFYKDSWQVFDTPEERLKKALEYEERVCKPLNEAYLLRKED